MGSENKKYSKNKSWCAELGPMSAMQSKMMKMMEECSPGIMEKCCNEERMMAMIKNCCGQKENQTKKSKNTERDMEQQINENCMKGCCS